MTEQLVKIMRLSSGEEIVSKITEQEHVRSVSVENPLKIITYPQRTSRGIEEQLSLQRWVHFTDNTIFEIPKSQILAMGTASIGLSKFYNYFVEKIHKEPDLGDDSPTDEELYQIEQDEIEEEFDMMDTPSKVYH
jgi:hypothetical protein